ncbi:hypothetical protein Ocin01_19691 [Orchesella cincta]|uniref:Uncharacterized protein n=1 Tax=Orchesella cincta TaxID=48709 RepID=A0A1D2M251_ORCCI|nr:hypothetical protein Ocin01_19691 [Orchesella cincta]
MKAAVGVLHCIDLLHSDDPFNEDFQNNERLGSLAWLDLLYLLIGAEMRLRSVNEIDESGTQLPPKPITMTLIISLKKMGMFLHPTKFHKKELIRA